MMASTGQAARNNPRRGAGIPRSILQELNWPTALIEDYDRISNLSDFEPLCGTQTPNGNITSNLSHSYYRTTGSTAEHYFNPVVGVNTGWLRVS